MRHFLLSTLGTIFGIILFFVGIILLFVVFGLAAGIKGAFTAKPQYVLTLDMRQSIRDQSAGPGLFGMTQSSTTGIVRKLHAAKDDANIKGLFIRANSYGMTPATAEELRLAVLDFKSSGKFVIAHAQGFEGTSVMPYLAVSAADEIWQQDTTGFSIAGMRSEAEFYGGVFEKIDAKPQIIQFYEYKNAANAYMQSDLTDAHRESTTSYLTSLYSTAVGNIAEDRKLSEGAITSVFKASPHSAEDVLAKGMIDKLGQYEVAKAYVKEKAGGDNIKFKKVSNYTAKAKYGGSAIALINGEGAVVNGSSSDGSNPFSSGVAMGGDTLAKAFDDAAKDKNVKAIVFRVSSPGGSPAASDQIHAAIARAKEAGKPVVISMGKYAASGGYYVSANADKIVAMPSTITGSIGVFGGKIAFRDSFAKIGYNIEGISVGGDFLGAFSADEPFTQGQEAAYRGQLQDIYDDFTGRVAEGRNIPIETVREIAKGRVWTGEQAKERGLVDELGGFMKAVDVAKELAEIEDGGKFYFKKFPKAKTTSEQIEELFGGSVEAAAELQTLREIRNLPEVKALLRARAAMEAGQELKADIGLVE